MFEVSSISSHTGVQPSTPRGRLPCRWHAGADQTISCGAAEVRILIGNVYKFKILAGKKLICEFSDGVWNVKSLNKLL